MHVKKIIKQLLGHMIRFILGRSRVALPIRKFVSHYPALAERMRIIRGDTISGKFQIHCRVNGCRQFFFRRPIEFLRNVIRNRYPDLYEVLLNQQFARRIYCDFVRPLIVDRPVRLAQQPPNSNRTTRDLVTAAILQASLVRAIERWQLGARLNDRF